AGEDGARITQCRQLDLSGGEPVGAAVERGDLLGICVELRCERVALPEQPSVLVTPWVKLTAGFVSVVALLETHLRLAHGSLVRPARQEGLQCGLLGGQRARATVQLGKLLHGGSMLILELIELLPVRPHLARIVELLKQSGTLVAQRGKCLLVRAEQAIKVDHEAVLAALADIEARLAQERAWPPTGPPAGDRMILLARLEPVNVGVECSMAGFERRQLACEVFRLANLAHLLGGLGLRLDGTLPRGGDLRTLGSHGAQPL